MTTNSTTPHYGIGRTLTAGRAASEGALRAMMRKTCVDIDGTGVMDPVRLLRMADACHFLSNNLPPAAIKAVQQDML